MSNPNDEFFSSDRCDAGIQIRREVMGGGFVDAALPHNAGSDGETLQKHITATAWGPVWSREGLAKRDRSLLDIGVLVALRAAEELRGHIKGALANGLTRTEITEAIVHAPGCCGVPTTLSAVRVAQEVLVAELGLLGDDNQQVAHGLAGPGRHVSTSVIHRSSHDGGKVMTVVTIAIASIEPWKV